MTDFLKQDLLALTDETMKVLQKIKDQTNLDEKKIAKNIKNIIRNKNEQSNSFTCCVR